MGRLNKGVPANSPKAGGKLREKISMSAMLDKLPKANRKDCNCPKLNADCRFANDRAYGSIVTFNTCCTDRLAPFWINL